MVHKGISAQTRVKLKEASKKRKRGLKGTPYAGKFLAGAGYSFASERGGRKPRMGTRGEYRGARFEKSKSETREAAAGVKNEYSEKLRKAGVSSPVSRERLSREHARSEVFRRTGETPTAEDLAAGPIRTTRATRRDVRRQLRESRWSDPVAGRGLYSDTWKSPTEGRYLAPRDFIDRELAPSHKAEIDKLLADPASPFNAGQGGRSTRGRTATPGARNRLERYTRALQDGSSHADALEQIRTARPGRRPGEPGVSGVSKKAFEQRRGETREPGRASKLESLQPQPGEFRFGVEATAPRTGAKLREQFPGLGAQDYVRLEQADRENFRDEVDQGARWAVETRRAAVLGDKSGTYRENPDKVTVFTTSVGHPQVNVPSDSVTGQYIIRRRRKAAISEGVATRAQLKGEFPPALRDYHIIQASLGVGPFVEGAVGLGQEVGVRVGGKKTRGFGNVRPLGGGVLTGSDGRPLYDEQGNLRFSEGVSRKYKFGTRRMRGARVFVG